MNTIQKALQLARRPGLATEYARYHLSRLRHGGNAVRYLFGEIEISSFNRFSEFASCRDFVSSSEYTFLRQHPFGSGSLVDVGANLGVISLILASRFSDQPVYAFEPTPSTYRALLSNLKRNDADNVLAEQLAVGDVDGSVQFRTLDSNRGGASFAADEDDRAESVPCIRLDTYAEIHGIENFALLKVDVEGYETPVFEGADRLLDEGRVRNVYYEVDPERTKRAGFDPSGPTRILANHGFDIYRLDDRGSLVPTSVTDVEELSHVENWIAVAS
jgi:FkbM family methyltransferase